MSVKTEIISIQTEGFGDTHDITSIAAKAVSESAISDGLLTVFVPGSTAGITTIEFESGAVRDLKDAIERQAPENARYYHNERWHDGNGFSHVRAAMIGPSITVPFKDGALQLGTWQQLVLLDFDNNSRNRRIVFQIFGE